ncbi:MAG: PqqD family protein [Actinomycetota bacterium]|nr:PqqD family protein [Actinomycetota bacterium]
MVKRRGDLAWRSVDGQVVGLDLEASCYFSVNATGALLWERLGEEADLEELVQLVVDTYALDADQARHDVTAFLAALSDQGLLAT